MNSGDGKKGVTLKKLMIAVAIIGSVTVVLAVLLIPSYQGYLPRSQISEAVSLLASAKTPVSEYLADKGKWPSSVEQVLQFTSGHYTDRIAITTGAGAASGTLTITATMKTSGVNSQLVGKTLQVSTEDGKTWTCGPGTRNGVDVKHLPAACRP